MSKITIIILLSISIQYVFTQNNSTDLTETIYGYLKYFFAGMADNENTSLCIELINDKKQDFLKNLEPIVNSLNNTQTFFNNFIKYGLNLITIHGFAKNCKILNVVIFYNKLTIRGEITNLGESVHNTARQIAGIFNKTVPAESIFKKVGKLAKQLLNIRVK